eukprot:gene1252-1592_t
MSDGRTPSSILKKRQAQEQHQRRRSLRAAKGRRVSFAPDEDLETMHLFKRDGDSPLPPQDTQPLAELVQNSMHHSGQQLHSELMPSMWTDKQHTLDQRLSGTEPPHPTDHYMLSPGMSPMSMDLTNDTLQQQVAAPFGSNENDSFTFSNYGALGSDMGVAAGGGLIGGFGAVKDGTQNITDKVPGLSTLVEEDEEQLYETSSEGVAMELTGNTDVEQLTSPGKTRTSKGRRHSSGTTPTATPPAAEPEAQPMMTPLSDKPASKLGLAPSMDPTPSPLKRITRSMSSSSPLLLSPLANLTEGLMGAGDGVTPDDEAGPGRSRRGTRPSHVRAAEQQSKWGFVPGEEDTLNLDMKQPGAGGLGDATLHHVYSDSAGTGDFSRAVRQGQLQQLPGGGRRRSSINRFPRHSLATEVIPEEAVTPEPKEQDAAAVAAAAVADPMPVALEMTEDMAISPDCTPAAKHGLQQHHIMQLPETPADAGCAMGDVDGLTTNLLLDDRNVVDACWGHLPPARASSGTGRGSVGSNVPTLHNLRAGANTTQLLGDSGHNRGDAHSLFPGAFAAGKAAGVHHGRGYHGGPDSGTSAGAIAGGGVVEECTTKLLADSTAAQLGSEPTLELAGAAAHGSQVNALEDATLDDFGALSLTNSAGVPGSVARTPGGSVRQAQPIAFTDFCQIVDMQFLTHIRRGTSISVMDFQPSTVPEELAGALQLLAVTSSEVAVLEGAMHQLQAELANKRREAYELEDRLSLHNPPVFATVQTARHTQLEQAKHCLVLLKKSCRALTAASWKELRIAMEAELADRLGQQQADLQEQLAFVQAKLQKAQQQREYAKSFHTDVLRKLAAEEAAQQEAAAEQRRLASLRTRLAELQSLNADRQRRAEQLQAQVAAANARHSELQSQSSALQARRDQLAAQVAANTSPAVSRQTKARLAAAQYKLELAKHLQGWHLTALSEQEWLVNFRNVVGLRLSLPLGSATASGQLVMLGAEAAPLPYSSNSMARDLLQALVTTLKPSCSFQVPKGLLSLAFTQAEFSVARALELAEHCINVFVAQPLLTAVDVLCDSSCLGPDTESCQQQSSQGGWLSLVMVEPEQQLKARVLLSLPGLLAAAQPAGISSRVDVLVCPELEAREKLQQQLSSAVTSVLVQSALCGSMNMLDRVCQEMSTLLQQRHAG